MFKGSDHYPSGWPSSTTPHPFICTLGSPHLLQRPCLAIVGARNASINAQRLAQSLAEELADEGYVILSGLARGIDAAAHNGALASGTIAVIAGSIDIFIHRKMLISSRALLKLG